MKNTIKISKEVMASLLPQKALLNSKVDEILHQTFKLNSVVESEDYDNENDRATGPVRLRYINTKTNAILTFPLRGLLFTNSTTVKDPKKFDEDSPVVVLHNRLMESASNMEDVEIPEEFTVMSAEPKKKVVAGAEVVMYPTYSYQLFQDRVDALKDGEDFGNIYGDFAFMAKLPGTTLAARFADIEPVKNIVISLD